MIFLFASWITISLSLFTQTECVFPRVCASNLTRTPSYCCPVPKGHDKPCGWPVRGICSRVYVYRDALTERNKDFYPVDIRFRWPERLFKYTCQCNSVFWGPDCGDCWFGYSGDNCTKRVTYTRRNILSYSPEERRRFVDVFMKVRETKTDYVIPKLKLNELRWTGEYAEVDPQELLNFIHHVSSIPRINDNRTACHALERKVWTFAHIDCGFPLYHRYLLLWWERMFRRVAAQYFGWHNFTFPYWDWTNSRQCDVCTSDLVGEASKHYDNITHGYFIAASSSFGTDRWKIYCQGRKNVNSICWPCTINRNHSYRLTRKWQHYEYPTVDEIIELLKLPFYENYIHPCQSAENILESSMNCTCAWKDSTSQLHLNIHQFIQGTMSPLSSSCYDPLFPLHHVQVDRLLERWRRGVLPGVRQLPNMCRTVAQCRDCNIAAFYPPLRYRDLFVDTRSLGYTLDNFDFGTLSEKIKIAKWSNKNYVKKCPKNNYFI